jgi:hypothetical protein
MREGKHNATIPDLGTRRKSIIEIRSVDVEMEHADQLVEY